MRLCSECERFDIQSLSADRCQNLHTKWRPLRPLPEAISSARSGCPTCLLMVAYLRGSVAKLSPPKEGTAASNGPNWQSVLENPFKSSRSWIFVSPVVRSPTGDIKPSENPCSPLGFVGLELLAAKTAYHLLDSELRGDFRCFFSTVADKDTEAARSGDVVGELKFSSNSFNNTYLKHVEKWLKNSEVHAVCASTLSGAEKINSTTASLPRRCVRLSYLSDEYKIVPAPEDRPHIELALLETKGLTGSYVCLSHRWAQPETGMASTTTSNYSDRLSGKSLDNLPPLFQDVFHVSAALGIRYVWIDSLCIVQDDAADWKRESGRMSDYYQRAAFTIATTTGQSSGQGLFGTTAPPLAQLPYVDKGGVQHGSFYLSPEPRHTAWAQTYSDLVRESDLLSRGWVVQEWLLSRRLVCFTEHGIFLQCRCPGEEAASISPDGLVTYHPTLFGNPELAIKSSLSVDFSSLDAIRHSWEEIVSQYSRRALSQPRKDRIVALRGIAAEFTLALTKTKNRALQEDEPIIGLLHDNILRGLLWEQTSRGRHERIQDFPTWSWASIYTGVAYQKHQTGTTSRYECTVVKVTRVKKEQLFSHASTHPRDTHPLPQYAPSQPTTSTSTTRISPQTEPTKVLEEQPPKGDTENFATIHLKARLIPVHIRGYLLTSQSTSPNSEETESVYAWTDASGHTSRDTKFPCTTQRAVVMPSAPGLVAGWASLEHPGFQGLDDGSSPTGERRVVVFALAVERVGGVSRGSLGLGYVSLVGRHGHDSLEVVFVVRHHGDVVDGFERVGRGAIFGREAMEGFDGAVERDLCLL
ncbi:heterokaryon incompatibility protein-domain-containing protein [Podospora aff. communis PSN243]|uniref:Heterokaryon incompatibility protein-domain-containing protein n=1 Tax=Podospora aff. communis PSN243 TaxID=3040156 RepID=A0AAV9GAP2_9PEZI|nr:heterokaryon incompatibility protein-domain-containing protein [Podospora aff. communis PSN243]